MRRLMMLLGLLVAGAVGLSAQTTNPLNLPLVDLSGVKPIGSFSIGLDDGAGGFTDYGGQAMGISEDGKAIYWSCRLDNSGIAKLEIPPLGGTARVLAPCTGPNAAELAKIHPDPNAWRPMLSGVVEYSGRVCVTGYIFYDASGQTSASHWCGPDLAHLTGPFGGTDPAHAYVRPGFVHAEQVVVPLEWRPILGGPVMASTAYGSIISRLSYTRAITIYDPATVTRNGFQLANLLGCPHSEPSCQTYGTPTDNVTYNGSEHQAGYFIAPGTRTLVSIERESTGPTCYGYATTNPALHGTPYPGPGYDAQHVPWCYSLSDPPDQKAPMGYPYKLVAKLWDMRELAAVKAGAKQPWEPRPYAVVDLPGSSPGERMDSGVFNPTTGQFLLHRYGGGAPTTITVYGGFGVSSTPPPPPTPTGTIAVIPPSITAGQSVTVSGTLQNITGGTVSPRIGAVTGPLWLATDVPTDTTTYTITAGSFTASATVTVAPPLTEVCGDGIDNDGDGLIDENCAVDCVETSGAWGPGPDALGWSPWVIAGTSETRYRDRTWTQTIAAEFGGASCTWTKSGGVGATAVEHVVDSRPYTPPPPPSFSGIVRAQTSYTVGGVVAGLRVALQVADAEVPAVPKVNAAATLKLPLANGGNDDRACTVWKIEPTGYATAGARSRVTVQCPGMTGVRVLVETSSSPTPQARRGLVQVPATRTPAELCAPGTVFGLQGNVWACRRPQ